MRRHRCFHVNLSSKKWLMFALNEESVLGAVRASEQFGLTAEQVIGWASRLEDLHRGILQGESDGIFRNRRRLLESSRPTDGFELGEMDKAGRSPGQQY